MADGEDVSLGYCEAAGLKLECHLCGVVENLLRCARCHNAYYCSRDHQKIHWKVHKRTCGKENKDTNNTSLSIGGISEGDLVDGEKLSRKSRDGNASELRSTENGETTLVSSNADRNNDISKPDTATPLLNGKSKPLETNTSSAGATSPHPMTFSRLNQKVKMHSSYAERIIENSLVMQTMCNQIVADLNKYGICVIDQFLGQELGTEILNEVNVMYSSGVFKDGQLVSNRAKDTTMTIRGDKITWVGGSEDNCRHIGDLIGIVDALVFQCNKQQHNGELSQYEIAGRTKAMVACYPGDGAQYVKHVDNPNQDGRCVTSIYYLNKDWNVNRGGILRIFPEGKDTVADIKPIFDRIVFFWSDRRNPHEVQASFQTRYAITLWYFDHKEREKAMLRYHRTKREK